MERIQPVVANVALLSVTDGKGRFLLVRHPETHKFESARGKLDLPNVEHPDEESVSEAIERLVPLRFGVELPKSSTEVLGSVQSIDHYPDRNEYRDTRRVFVAVLWPDVPTGEFNWHSLSEINEMASQLRRPFFLDTINNHRERIRHAGKMMSGYFRSTLYDRQNKALEEYVKENPWLPKL